ncbi:MerR family transcriptional regulator [Paraglaciecola sp. Hal342]
MFQLLFPNYSYSVKSIPSIGSTAQRHVYENSELSKKSGCSIQTIRFYEKQRLVVPCGRTEGNYRIYNNSALSTLSIIKQCRSLGLTIVEIKQLLDTKKSPDKSCSIVNGLVRKHMGNVQRRIAELKRIRIYAF